MVHEQQVGMTPDGEKIYKVGIDSLHYMKCTKNGALICAADDFSYKGALGSGKTLVEENDEFSPVDRRIYSRATDKEVKFFCPVHGEIAYNPKSYRCGKVLGTKPDGRPQLCWERVYSK